jgi:hypothetical protein
MDPGTALAVASLSFQLFAGCVKGFILISDAQNLGKDAALERMKLMLQEYRLVEWARAIHLESHKDDESPGFNRHLAALILVQLEQLLTSTETLKKRYKLELVSPPDNSNDVVLAEITVTQDDSASSVLSNIVSTQTRKGILDRVSKTSTANRLPKRFSWAAVDKRKYAQLVVDVTSLVDGLWSLLDITQRMQTSRAVNQTLQLAIRTSKDIEGLQDLQKSLQDTSTGAEVKDGLAASAGLKAKHVLLASSHHENAQNTAHSDDSGDQGTQERIPSILDPHQLTSIRMMTSTIGSALYQGNAVLIEEKRVQPKMKAKLKSRVETLMHLLSQPPTPSFRTLPCLGYTEEQGGFRLIFEFPSDCVPNTSAEQPLTLLSVLSRSHGPLPDVGTRLHLAVQVCETLLSFHTAGWLHKDVRSENILLISRSSDESTYRLGRPYLCGFSFARQVSPTEISEQPSADLSRDIYRHAEALGEPSESFERYMDAYSLGCVLVEIAEWTPLRKIVKKRLDTSADAGAKLTDVALLSQWLHGRYIGEGVAAFRLGVAFEKMLALCLPAPGEKPDLTHFYSALEGLVTCVI